MAKYLDYDGLAYLWQKIKEETEVPGLESDEAINTLFDTEVDENANQVNFGTGCADEEIESILTVEGAVIDDTLIVS